MRHACALAWGLLLLAPAPGVARGAQPRAEADIGDGVVVLRTEGPSELLVRGGSFVMGSDVPAVIGAYELCALEPRREQCLQNMFADELSAHRVTLSDYWLDRTEVPNRAYRRCVEAGACPAPSSAGALTWTRRDDEPATLVSWSEAATYCRWAGRRLPTEAEWERAAVGWTHRRYPWGDVWNPMLCNHGRYAFGTASLDDGDGFAELAPVGSFPAGRTPEGIDDLAGNVEEWVADWYTPGYLEGEQHDPRGPDSGDHRVVRGGSFQSGRAWLRAAARDHDIPSARRAWRGFRCARDAAR
ncbi:MAG: SUMF1/EgtB/PvdO family nonheme iron enzyme [Myxococcales bacterium]|nr:SUMF1/EgtB/PvdO family nonheme iron enzyme [Myxococcales bacterium]